MFESSELLFTISWIFHYIALVLVTIASIVIFTKKRTLGTTILLIGAILSVITIIVSFGVNLSGKNQEFETIMKAEGYIAILSSISYGLFCLGLFLFATTDYKKEKPKNEFLD